MAYQPSVYREHGGDKLIVTSSGRGHAAGEIEIQSGGTLDIQSGAKVTLPVQALGVADVATNIIEFGITTIVASTTAPTYTLAGPSVAGLVKHIYVESNTSSGTAKINTSSTGVSVGSSGANQLTVDATHDAAILVSTSTVKWRLTSNVSMARATKTT